ncbi:MAG: hypothetical protein R3B70_32325 [Polyangiaceae bacterium]
MLQAPQQSKLALATTLADALETLAPEPLEFQGPPVVVLTRQSPERLSFEPEEHVNEAGLAILEGALRSRVGEGPFSPSAIRRSAVYSGGFVWKFFRLLRAGVEVAQANDLAVVDDRVMRVVIKEERLNESQSLREVDYRALAEVHRTNEIGSVDRSYLDDLYVIAYRDDHVWYEVAPVLWSLLKSFMS